MYGYLRDKQDVHPGVMMIRNAFDSINRETLWYRKGKRKFCEEVVEFIKIK